MLREATATKPIIEREPLASRPASTGNDTTIETHFPFLSHDTTGR